MYNSVTPLKQKSIQLNKLFLQIAPQPYWLSSIKALAWITRHGGIAPRFCCRVMHNRWLESFLGVATLPGAWHDRVCARTCCPVSVSMLWLGEAASVIYSFCLCVAACTVVWADLSEIYFACCWGVRSNSSALSCLSAQTPCSFLHLLFFSNFSCCCCFCYFSTFVFMFLQIFFF